MFPVKAKTILKMRTSTEMHFICRVLNQNKSNILMESKTLSQTIKQSNIQSSEQNNAQFINDLVGYSIALVCKYEIISELEELLSFWFEVVLFVVESNLVGFVLCPSRRWWMR